MFAPPADVATEVFASLPAGLRMRDKTSEWSFGKAQAGLHSFLEGPCFDRDGSLFVTDIPYGRIFRVSPAGDFELYAEYEGEPNGLAIHKDGTIYIADHRNGLLSLDPRSREIRPVLRRVRREGFKGLNDLTFDQQGNLYFTDQGQTGMQDPSGRVYRLRPSGQVDLLIDNVPSPNGLALSPDERILYLAVTRANQIWRLPLHPDGSTTKVNVFLHLQGGHTGPDGLAVDAAGNLAVCHCGLGTVWIFSSLGEPLHRIRSGLGLDTANAAYGGPENKVLYIVEAATGTILTARLPVAGLRLYSRA